MSDESNSSPSTITYTLGLPPGTCWISLYTMYAICHVEIIDSFLTLLFLNRIFLTVVTEVLEIPVNSSNDFEASEEEVSRVNT